MPNSGSQESSSSTVATQPASQDEVDNEVQEQIVPSSPAPFVSNTERERQNAVPDTTPWKSGFLRKSTIGRVGVVPDDAPAVPGSPLLRRSATAP